MPQTTMSDDDPYASMAVPTKPASGSALHTVSAQDDDPYAALAETTPKPDYSRFTANTKRNAKGELEGTYTMLSPEGELKPIPYSNVLPAWKAGFKIDPEDREKYADDLFADLKKTHPQARRDALVLPEAYSALLAAPERWSKEWWKQRGYDAIDMATGLLPVAGGMAGGMIGYGAGGGPAGGPVSVATATGGAMLGGAAGETGRLAINRAVFSDPVEVPKKTLKRIAAQGALQGASELTGRALDIPLRAAGKYLGETALESKRAGIPLLPSEAHGKAPAPSEKLLRSSAITSGQMDALRETQNKAAKKAVNDLAAKMGNFTGTREDLGKLVQQGIEDYRKQFRADQEALYSAIDQKAAQNKVYVDPRKLKAFATSALKEIDAEEQVIGKSQLAPIRTMLEEIKNNPAKITKFKTMMDARSSLLGLVRDDTYPLAGKRAGLLKKLASLADESMEDAANSSGIPGFLQQVRAANTFTREGHERFEQDLIKKIVDTKKPDTIAALLLTPSAPLAKSALGLEETRDLFKMLPATFHGPVQRQVILDAAEQSIDKASGMLKERVFARKIEALGDEKGKIIFGKNWPNVKKLSGVLAQITGPTSRGVGTDAVLRNIASFKGLVTTIAGLPVAALGTGLAAKEFGATGVWPVVAGAGVAAADVAFMKSLAWAMTNPDKAAEVLKVAQMLVRSGRVTVPATAALAQSRSDRRKRGISPPWATPGVSAQTLRQLQNEARKRKPVAAAGMN